MPERLKSRKFWVTIGASLIPIINEAFNLQLSQETGIALALVIASYLFGQSYVDGKQRTAEVQAGADVARLSALQTARAYEAELARVLEEKDAATE